jgi:hypothetical protein
MCTGPSARVGHNQPLAARTQIAQERTCLRPCTAAAATLASEALATHHYHVILIR